MTDENLETKPLTTVIEQPTPDTTEGEEMTLEILAMRVKIIEVEINALKEWRTTLLTREQIVEIVKETNAESVKRVETLLNTIVTTVGDNVFDTARIDSIDAKLTTRAQNAAVSDRKLDAVIGWINIMAARDVTDPDSKAIAEPYFDTMKRLVTEANALSIATALDFSQGRVDHAESMHELKAGITTVNAIAAELRPLALSVARAQTLIDFGVRLAKRPRLAFGVFVAGLAAFGGGAVLTPEVIKLIGNAILSIFAGAN